MKLPKVYEPAQYESDIYKLWESSGAFTPKGEGEPFTIIMPPPNANANLHVGQALGNSIQDVLTRYHRMNGQPTLWLPGADHAGFETWVVYEKQLAKEGKSRFDFTREELYSQVWDFVQLNKTNFETQYRSLGLSCDWSRFTFTLDQKVVKVAYNTFKKMWDDKLIYRGERLVNYCTYHGTGFSDYEVEYEDRTTPLYYLKYGPFELATTRPETKFGDTAVAVNPKDERYQKYVGQTIEVEGVNGPFTVQVVADDMVDMKFGTGVVKITPAHDFNDWEVAQRHNLPAKTVIGYDGRMTEVAGRFSGMTVLDAREAVAEALKEKGLLVKIDEHYKNRVGLCYKCGTVIEPMLMDQWFVKMQPLAKKAIAALKDKSVTFYPESKRLQVIDYLKNIKDWNISRQIPWGIPIPAFQNTEDPDDWIFDEHVDKETITVKGKTYRRDSDVFDTWFSSDQWPYITLNYPDGDDFKKFYPTSILDTAGEILFVWVARMIMMGLYVTGDVPFKEVYIHGNVKAEDGTKMSKSKGNAINPIGIIDEYGADALRIGMLSGRTAGAHQAYAQAKVIGGRNFCNKLWNIARYVEDTLGSDFDYQTKIEARTLADHWILGRLAEAGSSISHDLDNYNFASALETVQQLVRDDFADWYIEASKTAPNKQLLAYALEVILKLAHPFAPFVTEAIWQTLGWEKDSLLITRPWPKLEKAKGAQSQEFGDLQLLVSEVRQLITALGLKKPSLQFAGSDLLASNQDLAQRLAGLGEILPVNHGEGLKLTLSPFTAWLAITDEQLDAYKKQIEAERTAAIGDINRLEGRLKNKGYRDNAPPEVVAQTEAQLKEAQSRLDRIDQELERFMPA